MDDELGANAGASATPVGETHSAMPQTEALFMEMQRLSVSARAGAQQASSSTTADDPVTPGASDSAPPPPLPPPPPAPLPPPQNGVQPAGPSGSGPPAATHQAPAPASTSAATPAAEAEASCATTKSSEAAGTPGQQGQPAGPAGQERARPSHVLEPTSPAPGDARVGLLYDNSMERHMGPDHYERPARIIAVHEVLQEQELMGRCWQLVSRQATDSELLLGHTEEHIRKVDALFDTAYPARPESLAGAGYCFAEPAGAEKGDVYVCGDTAAAARMATGCCVEAVSQVLSGAVSRALAIVRPPGHHAECERAQGFCFFNNVAVAALAALQHPDVKRVAVLDWDIHHGNGIQNILLQRPDALYLSLHRDPKRFYPFTSGFVGEVGAGPGEGFNVNVPWLKKGMGDGDYMAAFSLVVEPVLTAYDPDLVLVAAGFDAADGDPLGGCKVSPEGYAWMTERLLRFAGGKLILALEGGYNNRVTAWCAAACVRALLEGAACPGLPRSKEHLWPAESHDSLKRVYEVQRQYWAPLRERSYGDAWEAHLREVNLMLGSNSRAKRGSGTGGGGGCSSSGAAAPAPASSCSSAGAVGGGRRPSGSEGATSARQRSASGSGAAPAPAPGSDGAAPAAQPQQSLADAFKARRAARTSGTGKTSASGAAAAATATATAAAAPARPPPAARQASGLRQAEAPAPTPAGPSPSSSAFAGPGAGAGEGQAGEVAGEAAAEAAAGAGYTAESAGPVASMELLADEVLPDESDFVEQPAAAVAGGSDGGGGGASGVDGAVGRSADSPTGAGEAVLGAAGGPAVLVGVPMASGSLVAVGGEA
ncbi:hypothetical protein HYH02_008135 [Chlamydomonas schloesseri]|uniref:histone deacetylase n=1 Tax=Chlamydomonas schloesseri TaxID=2026947 RepID=A0A835WGH6_9CHLO|nr:hypothetical protein HYH02_008135 [Chlamydomonas schloesseri]|eukprot:KAG2446981.1 hypothetical protein HYH02_008135 [Chlamydomonas schloesseri]